LFSLLNTITIELTIKNFTRASSVSLKLVDFQKSKKTGNAFSDALLMSRLPNFAADSRDIREAKRASRGFN